ncbi:DUF6221 family protein [Streptomyces longwoodensis]|uniref:DUF6221 family protein n=1 Tax=Streptomyces longwoodensis TaxID=68231 RepID=UPI0033F2DB00
MDDLVGFLIARINDDHHAYAYVAGTLGGDALLGSRLPMLDLAEQLANDYKAIGLSDSRSAGPAYALRVLGQSYAEHPAYQQDWRP